VAENQPGENKNRMGHTTTLSVFAARVREFIELCNKHWERTAGKHPCATPETDFAGLTLELFGLQYQHNAAYRRFCEVRGARPGRIDDWRSIPAIPTVGFKEFDLSCLPVAERTAVFYSSGTTGRPRSRHFHNAESLALYEASLLNWFARNLKLELQNEMQGFGSQGLARSREQPSTSRQRMLFLTPNGLSAPNSSLVHMFETARGKFGSPESVFVGGAAVDGGWTLNLEAALDALRFTADSEQSVMLLGTAFSFVHLLDYLADRKLHFELPPGSLALETGGYKSRSRSLPKAELHSLIRQRLGISPAQIICEYGMSELGSQAYASVLHGIRNPHCAARVFHFPPWCRVQIISPETGLEAGEGETGLIRIFDLANVYSVMAIQTEDLGLRRGENFELIGRAELSEPRGCSLMAVEAFSK
jgi:hypothetical protein